MGTAKTRWFFSSLYATAFGFFITLAPGDAGAAVIWTFDTANCVSTSGPAGNCGSGDANFSDFRTYQGSGGAGNVTVSGWANTTGGNERLQLGQITHYNGGLGVVNADAGSGDANENSQPETGIDNDDRFDLVLFDFGTQFVDLREITIGAFNQDSDISVLAYTGNLDPTDSAGAHYLGDQEAWWNSNADKNETLTSNGWSLVGNHDVDSGPGIGTPQDINSTDLVSNYWLVSAFNPVFGISCTPSNSFCQSDYEDYFNILNLVGDIIQQPTAVPEPPALLLMAMSVAGLAGLGLAGRRRAKANH